MDTLTHALSGALAVRALGAKLEPEPARLRHLTWVGLLTAAAPDLDFIVALVSDQPMTYLNTHRGVTHSLLLLPIWAGLLAGLFRKLFHELPFRQLYLVSALSLGLHILGDVITSYGTMIFAPVSNWRAALDTTFIIDPIFSGIILSGLVAAFWTPYQRLGPRLAAAVLIGYVGLQGWAHEQSRGVGQDYARRLGVTAQVHALPQPLSPLFWKLVVIDADRYHLAHLRLYGDPVRAGNDAGFFTRLASAYQAPNALTWNSYPKPDSLRLSRADVRQAWSHPVLHDYRIFARFPVLAEAPGHAGSCVWFGDLRFQLPERRNPFIYGLCNNPVNGESTLRRFR